MESTDMEFEGEDASSMTNSGSGASSKQKLPVKRKAQKARSIVWEHFSKFVEPDGSIMCKCKHCEKTYHCDTKKNGTSTLKHHMSACKKIPKELEGKQTQLNLQPSSTEGEGVLSTYIFDEEAVRKAIARMIIIDELSFKHVEGEGFRNMMAVACPRFRIPSRQTVARDCLEMFLAEKVKLKKYFTKHVPRVCITTDTWNSLQRVNYMCVTTHFIDEHWNLRKHIISFSPITCHRRREIGKEIENFLIDWGIEKLMSITVDNASSNDVAVTYLKDQLKNWRSTIANAKYIHVRCVAHIINLIVVEGLKEINTSVAKVRAVVRYVRHSPSRLQKFKDCVEAERIKSKGLLSLDVCTRWNSTYLMLETAQKFERAFKRYEDIDPYFKSELVIEDEVDGIPDSNDWANVRLMVSVLAHFYKLTLKVSGSLYVTSNLLFHEVSAVYMILKQWQNSHDENVASMAERMMRKYTKYWGDVKKMNKMIYFAVVLDPRYKLEYV